MKLLIISALILIGSIAKADLDRLVLDSNNQLHQVPAAHNEYNHPTVDYYNSDGSSSKYQGNMIYNSDGSETVVRVNGGKTYYNPVTEQYEIGN